MNLRIKVKKAKKELDLINQSYKGSSTWDIYKNFEATKKLQGIINLKKKPSRLLRWTEVLKVKWNEITYFSFRANSSELLTIVSPNGKPFSNSEIEDFLNKCRLKMYNYGLAVSEKPKSDEIYTNYIMLTSNNRKKQKVLHLKKIYKQYNGEVKIHNYNDILMINIEEENDNK